MNSLRITEIFFSLQGESRTVGMPTVFIRLTGCPLRCHYCDTAYAFSGGKRMTFDEIFDAVSAYRAKHITVTGGEPLAQPECIPLMSALCDRGYEVSIETSGALDVSAIDPRVIKVMDLKTPDSGECEKNLEKNIEFLTSQDQIKFVIGSRKDYEWSKAKITEYQLTDRCEVLFSPSHQVLGNDVLAGWILEDQLSVRFQIQLHKYIWGEERGR